VTPSAGPRPQRRTDPHRRDRIIDACLDVIAEAGVDGTTHRKVAAAADVPLGSMTYHFAGMDELLREAFTRFADGVAERTRSRISHARTPQEAQQAVVNLIVTDVFSSSRDLVLAHELYTLAARQPEYRTITQTWMAQSRDILEQHFDPVTARMLDALIEGLSIHRALDTASPDDALVAEAVQRMVRP